MSTATSKKPLSKSGKSNQGVTNQGVRLNEAIDPTPKPAEAEAVGEEAMVVRHLGAELEAAKADSGMSTKEVVHLKDAIKAIVAGVTSVASVGYFEKCLRKVEEELSYLEQNVQDFSIMENVA